MTSTPGSKNGATDPAPPCDSSKGTTTTPPCDATIEVDVIVPVHNAAATLAATLRSALTQVAPVPSSTTTTTSTDNSSNPHVKVFVCCYDDGSTDTSWEILTHMAAEYNKNREPSQQAKEDDQGRPYLPTTLVLGRSSDGVARGAGYARNRAVALRPTTATAQRNYLCMLDSDDRMQPTRIAQQVAFLQSLPHAAADRTLVGCRVVRDPPDATWHYTQWANGLTDERLVLEQFREVTLLQPTWMMARAWFLQLSGYLEAPSLTSSASPFCIKEYIQAQSQGRSKDDVTPRFQLVHSSYDTAETLRLAEDTRFFYKHLAAGGVLRLLPSKEPLLIYRHREGQSQSAQTPRRLLLNLRLAAFTHLVLHKSPHWKGKQFCVWGAGRDGKDFIKALRPEVRERIACIVDVDPKKINIGYYYHKVQGFRIPVVHFSLLARDASIRARLRAAFEDGRDVHEPGYGRIHKGKDVARQQQGAAVATIEAEIESTTEMTIEREIETNLEREMETTANETIKIATETAIDATTETRIETPIETPVEDAIYATIAVATNISTDVATRPTKRRKVSRVTELDEEMLRSLPVVVCVSMYRTGGALEHNVQQIGRTEGVDLWHFS
jgi:glycosyltransferase involved in cell wall biosynthesis